MTQPKSLHALLLEIVSFAAAATGTAVIPYAAYEHHKHSRENREQAGQAETQLNTVTRDLKTQTRTLVEETLLLPPVDQERITIRLRAANTLFCADDECASVGEGKDITMAAKILEHNGAYLAKEATGQPLPVILQQTRAVTGLDQAVAQLVRENAPNFAAGNEPAPER